jgi:multidrug resistance efflux pump
LIFSDAETTRLQQAWEQASAQRDAIRDELRKTKEELTKEREQLEAEHKKLLAKLERAKKVNIFVFLVSL